VFERDHTAKLALSIVRDATAAIFLGSMVQLITQRQCHLDLTHYRTPIASHTLPVKYKISMLLQ